MRFFVDGEGAAVYWSEGGASHQFDGYLSVVLWVRSDASPSSAVLTNTTSPVGMCTTRFATRRKRQALGREGHSQRPIAGAEGGAARHWPNETHDGPVALHAENCRTHCYLPNCFWLSVVSKHRERRV